MNRTLAMTLGLLLVASVASAATPQPSLSGDRKLDSILRGMNTDAKADPEGLVSQISTLFKIPAQDIRQVRDEHGLDPAGTYMAAALAHATQRPVFDVARDYKQNEGQGWGAMAQRMGIKPGSPAFHELKRGGQGCLNHIRADAKQKRMHEQKLKKEHERQMKGEQQGKGGGRPR